MGYVLDFLRELKAGPEHIPRCSGVQVIGLDESLYLADRKERLEFGPCHTPRAPVCGFEASAAYDRGTDCLQRETHPWSQPAARISRRNICPGFNLRHSHEEPCAG